MKRFLAVLAALLLLAATAAYVLLVWPLRDKHPAVRLASGAIAVRDATIYISPDQPPLHHATLVARNGRLVAAGPSVPVPFDAQLLPCSGCTVTAAFWNTHVHFTEPKWQGAAWQNRAKLDRQLADMLTSHGFTTVVDLGSDIRVTVSLRRRIENSELHGPFIYTAGAALYPENGVPYYVRETTPKYLIRFMPQPATPIEAVGVEKRNIRWGADVLKLFTGSYVAHGHIKPMREPIVRAAVEAAHQHGQVAFAHPSNLEGVRVALAGGVDVLAHTPDTTEGINEAFVAEMAQRAAMIPTLKMFATTVTRNPAYLNPIYAVVRRFHDGGGTLLFGTDVGYMTDYSTADEFAALSQCGLTFQDILRMLTVAPATRLGVAGEKGTLEAGKLADFVILRSDPANNPNAWTAVQATVRSGQVIWRAASR